MTLFILILKMIKSSNVLELEIKNSNNKVIQYNIGNNSKKLA